MNEQEYFGNIGEAYEEEQAERLKECATLIAEKAGISLEEAAAAISNVLQVITDGLKEAFGSLKYIFQEIEEAAALLEVEPRARRRKKARSRARFIEQRYRAEIRRAEGERIYRRIYKPP